MGWTGSAWETFFTRLHVQYDVSLVHQDLQFYTSGIGGSDQIRYIVYAEELEDRFPICGEETPEDPGSCDESSSDAEGDSGSSTEPGADDEDVEPGADPGLNLGVHGEADKSGCGCAVSSASGVPVVWLAILLGWSRRRR